MHVKIFPCSSDTIAEVFVFIGFWAGSLFINISIFVERIGVGAFNDFIGPSSNIIAAINSLNSPLINSN